jgi:CRISPR-associated exonuclease Cas4
VWAENFHTAEGQLLHQRVDSGAPETRKGIRYERSVSVAAEKLGLTGKLDLVEVDLATGEQKPVEYIRTQLKSRSSRARGLKLTAMYMRALSDGVALFASAWIETRFSHPLRQSSCVALFASAWIETSALAASWSLPVASRSSRARGLKHRQSHFLPPAELSRSSRARGLKHVTKDGKCAYCKSRSSRARGLKL